MHKNSFKFILKFWFLFEVSSPAISPPVKISKTPLSSLFFSPLDFEKFQFPPDFVEFKNPVPAPLPKGGEGGGGAAMTNGAPANVKMHQLIQTEVGEHYLLILCPAHKIELVIKDAFEQSDFNNNCNKDYVNVYYLF